jgi:hypothetical protein
MRKSRWLAPWKDDPEKPVIYHVISRIVDRRFVLGDEEREHFKMLMRMYENFSGCRVLSYCIMSNHFHILLEVPPKLGEEVGSNGEKEMNEASRVETISDEDFFKRLDGLYSPVYVDGVREELRAERGYEKEARRALSLGKISQEAYEVAYERLQNVKGRFLYRMHDLSEFMKGLLQRFTSWFNRMNGRKGTLWEDRFKSVIVEDGTASRTMAAYIDLNPVRAGMVDDPADYRWSSYGEAAAGGKKARAGLVRALHAHQGTVGSSRAWSQKVGEGAKTSVAKGYRAMLLRGAVEVISKRAVTSKDGAIELEAKVSRKGMKREEFEAELKRLETSSDARDLAISKAVSCRVRYFADGAVIGSRAFVNGVFEKSRERFGPRRRDGARKPRGALEGLAGEIWAFRDLQEE